MEDGQSCATGQVLSFRSLGPRSSHPEAEARAFACTVPVLSLIASEQLVPKEKPSVGFALCLAEASNVGPLEADLEQDLLNMAVKCQMYWLGSVYPEHEADLGCLKAQQLVDLSV